MNPRHIAIIMDGNGRWAKARNKDRTFGHLEGSKNVRRIALAANKMNIEALTLYAFSTENWARPKAEVSYLMKLPKIFLDEYLQELMENNVKIETIGHMEGLPKATIAVFDYAKKQTENNTGLILNFALNYGSKNEIVEAVNLALADGVTNITTTDIESRLMTHHLPAIDLCIRTSGEQRLSNFLLWQLAYSELYFTEAAWPDFDQSELEKAVAWYQGRQRRFGGL
ncbi:MAG: isoprenyl transferase [Erysipelothrix sp.]|jgi:undecaprenyl diphosphate synthase|nr:isoprenyl transferase [Erysipelothrix sp.]